MRLVAALTHTLPTPCLAGKGCVKLGSVSGVQDAMLVYIKRILHVFHVRQSDIYPK